jgi:hypothetical protein
MEDDRELAKRVDAGRVLVFTRQNETIVGLRLGDEYVWGLDAVAICRRVLPYCRRNHTLVSLAVEYADLWDIIGKDVVVSDPEKIARLEQFVAEYNRRRRKVYGRAS